MSFSLEIKQELSEITNGARHCDIAELSAVFGSGCEIVKISGKTIIRMHTENHHAALRCAGLIKKIFGISPQVLIATSVNPLTKDRGASAYTVRVSGNDAEKILNAAGFHQDDTLSPLTVSGNCCKRAFIRGAFIVSGSLNNPEKSYHAEFISPRAETGEFLLCVLNSFSLNAKPLNRKGNHVAYIKDSRGILDLLNVMQAHRALLSLANVKVFKDVRNDVNRKVNFEAANLNKTISASVKQFEEISLIKDVKGLSFLNARLREAAELRLRYPDASLTEIGAMFETPVSKSGVNHRFRKISEIAGSIYD